MLKKLSSAFLGLLILSACNSTKTLPNDTQLTEENNEPVEITVVDKLENQLEIFNAIYKKALFATGKEQSEEALKTTKETLVLWEGIEKNFANNQPIEYQLTQAWSDKVIEIGDKIRIADALNQESKYVDAHEELEFVRKALKNIRFENERLILSDYMLIFHDTMEEVIESGTDKNIELIKKLNADLQPILKEKGSDNYQTLAKELEKIVNDLEETRGDKYEEVLNKIKPAFIQIYLQFG